MGGVWWGGLNSNRKRPRHAWRNDAFVVRRKDTSEVVGAFYVKALTSLTFITELVAFAYCLPDHLVEAQRRVKPAGCYIRMSSLRSPVAYSSGRGTGAFVARQAFLTTKVHTRVVFAQRFNVSCCSFIVHPLGASAYATSQETKGRGNERFENTRGAVFLLQVDRTPQSGYCCVCMRDACSSKLHIQLYSSPSCRSVGHDLVYKVSRYGPVCSPFPFAESGVP